MVLAVLEQKPLHMFGALLILMSFFSNSWIEVILLILAGVIIFALATWLEIYYEKKKKTKKEKEKEEKSDRL